MQAILTHRAISAPRPAALTVLFGRAAGCRRRPSRRPHCRRCLASCRGRSIRRASGPDHHRAFNKEIADKALPGVTMHGRAQGQAGVPRRLRVRDPARPEPVAVDSLFRITPCTKPLASVAAMILVEEGRLQLSDPVAKHLPAFKDMQALQPPAPACPPDDAEDRLRYRPRTGLREILPNRS